MEENKPAHSPLGASSYYRWKACPGSIRQCKGLESKESAYAAKGTLAHTVAALILEGKPFTYDGLEEEDIEAIRVYTEFVWGIFEAHREHIDPWVEKRFDLTSLVPGAFGTADCVLYHEELRKLVVIDYKHGAGIPVEVEENPQLMYYGLGALNELKQPVDSIELVVVQPRCFHVDGPIRRWITTPQRMMDFVADLIDDAAKTEDPKAELNPGDWCRFCPAQAMHCPAVRAKSLALAKLEFKAELTYDPAKLAEALRATDMMQDWITSVREFAYREAQHGRTPPGFKVVAKRAMRKWKEPFTPDQLAKEFGLRPPDCMTVDTKSPAQIEKLLPKKNEPLRQRFDGMVVAVSSGNTLVEETDPRPALAAAARDVFDVIS